MLFDYLNVNIFHRNNLYLHKEVNCANYKSHRILMIVGDNI